MRYIIVQLYRTILVLGILILSTGLNSDAQNAPSNVSQVPAAANTPAAINSIVYQSISPMNYVRSWQAKKPLQAESAIYTNNNVDEIDETTQYMDGLGRPIQVVNFQSSPNKTDIVAPVVYDEFNRVQYKYLPYASDASDGEFKNEPFLDQWEFYALSYPDEQLAYKGETFFYSQIQYEASPLNRVQKTLAAGNTWVGNDKGIAIKYLFNTSSEAIRIWNIGNDANNFNNNVPATTAVYDPQQLYKSVIIDEHGKAVVEYRDKDNRVILKKVQVADNINADFSGYDGWLSTYYVYDDYNQLRFVISPKAVNALIGKNWDFSQDNGTIINELCYRYEYDSRNRMIAKKMPGTNGWSFMVYDKRNRLVFMQDPNMQAKQSWAYTLFDDVNRPIQTGMMQDNISRATLQSQINILSDNSSAVSISSITPSSIPAQLLVTQIDPGRTTYEAADLILQGDFTIDPVAYNIAFAEFKVSAPNPGTFTSTQTINTSPIPANIPYTALTLTYYDDYNWTGKRYDYTNNDVNGKLDKGSNLFPDPLPSQQVSQVVGLVTGARVRVIEDATNLDAGSWLETATFYDNKIRPVQTQAGNYKGGTDIVTTLYNFSNQAVCTYALNSNQSGAVSALGVKTNMNYDHEGRLLTTVKQVDNSPAVVISDNAYDDLGRLLTKNLGQQRDASSGAVISGTYIHVADYSYNIRGWLKGINWQYGNGNNSSQVDITQNKWFGLGLSYDWGFTKSQYNGSIAGQRWVSASDMADRAFGYGYDNTNRLLFADFNQDFGAAGSPLWQKNNQAGDLNIDFSTTIGDGVNYSTAYDESGNIKAIEQKGLLINNSQPIDKLTYNYQNNETSNKLLAVTEDATIGNHNFGLGDFTDNNNTLNDYTYDDNGNLTSDKNKKITSIAYNYLNLPWQVTVNNIKGNSALSGIVTYIYDAAGNKLQKTVQETNQVEKITDYVNGFIYENNTLQFFAQEEGRIRRTYQISSGAGNYVFNYDYFLKDHLDNVRMVLTDQKQKDNYPMATLEAASISNEQTYYSIPTDAATRVLASSVPGYPADNTTSPNDYIQKLTGTSTGTKIGSSIILRVMAGDVVSAKVSSWYAQNSPPPASTTNIVNDILAQLLASMYGIPAASGGKISSGVLSGTQLTPSISGASNGFLTDRDNYVYDGTRPKAYLNMVLLDEQMRPVITNDLKNTGFMQAATGTVVQPLVLADREISRNGYLYVYVSNETQNVDVYFDNLQVSHTRGPLLEESHYYPFGLAMAGISSKAMGSVAERYKFNSNEEQREEFSDASGLETMDFNARMYDAQTGRFWQPDPLGENMRRWSPYEFAFDNPVLYADPTGLKGEDPAAEPDRVPEPPIVGPNNTLEEVVVVGHKPKGKEDDDWSISNLLGKAAEFTPFLGSALQIGRGIIDGNWKEAALGVVSLGIDAFTGGEGGELLRVGEEFAEDGLKVAAEDELREVSENELEEEVVYRGLSEDDVSSIAEGDGISARDPSANNSAISHVAGKKQSRWISTTKSEKIAKEKFGNNGYVKINLRKVKSDKVFLNKGINNGGRFSSWAKNAQEILIEKHIPQEAIKIQ